MKPFRNRLSSRILAAFSALFSTADRESDHRRLTRYLVTLNQKTTPGDIIAEVSLCLKEILNYRLFAFVIKQEGEIDVWLDPRMYKKSLESVFINDFSLTRKSQINYLNHMFHTGDREMDLSLKNLTSYDLIEENCQAKMYMLPSQTMLDYHDEIINIILKSTGIALSRQMNIARLTNAAALDSLTGCYNRREFDNQIQRSIADADRHKKPLSLIMFDIDHFKEVNDTHGHPAGDEALKKIARLVGQSMRGGDTLARYGGEEFVAILPETERNKAIELAERLRLKIQAAQIKTDRGIIRVTASFGIAQRHHRTDSSRLIMDADEMLYKAKLSGRNRVMPGLIKISPPLRSLTL